MECCIHCFNDSYIIELIKSEDAISDCDYCGAEETFTIHIEFLTDDFENLFSIYEPTMHGEHFHHELHCPTDYGDSLEEVIQDDWNIFSDETNQNTLLFDILNYRKGYEDYLDPYELYSKHEEAFTYISSSSLWNEFKLSIKRENRFFPDYDLSKELKLMLTNKSVNYQFDYKFYRARIGESSIDKMGPPPANKATPGRANPKGIPYLYVANDYETCIAETRPWIGANVTISTLHSEEPINIIDLSTREFLSSPFLAENLSETLQVNNLLNQLSYELSKLVDPFDYDIEYIPTQYLAELIKKLGYDGLSYKSSLGPGTNFVFFYPEKFNYIANEICNISAINYGFKRIP